jgi:uncharacterized protein YndB with AHSA1/START domain
MTTHWQEPTPELRRRTIPAGEARAATFTRTYDTTVEDLWDACTNPARLRRWYTEVGGDLRAGGTFSQPPMGTGSIEVCRPPEALTLSLGGGVDQIELAITPGPVVGTATLRVEHATTLDAIEIGGQMFDAIYCMGGGYYPRLLALDQHLRGTLPDDYDVMTFHLDAAMRPAIDRGSATMAALLATSAPS